MEVHLFLIKSITLCFNNVCSTYTFNYNIKHIQILKMYTIKYKGNITIIFDVLGTAHSAVNILN